MLSWMNHVDIFKYVISTVLSTSPFEVGNMTTRIRPSACSITVCLIITVFVVQYLVLLPISIPLVIKYSLCFAVMYFCYLLPLPGTSINLFKSTLSNCSLFLIDLSLRGQKMEERKITYCLNTQGDWKLL